MKNIKLAAREGRPTSIVKAGTATFGTGFAVIAGPCAVETEEQTVTTARAVKAAGADMLRGGAFKPRTSPYAFQGHGMEGLKILGIAGAETGLPIVTEVVDPRDVSWVSEYADMLQIGTRNMQNFALLKEVGQSGKPVMLKRGMYSTLEEWLNCAEYILGEGNPNVILCERGIRSFEQYTRNTLDLSAGPMAMASVAVGAHGVMVEVHCNPSEALCDAKQALTIDGFKNLMRRLRGLEAYLAGQDTEEEVTE